MARIGLSLLLLLWLSGTFEQPVAAQRTAVAQPAPSSVLDDPYVRAQAKQGLDLLYDMKFEDAAVRFERVDRRFPKHPIGPFLKALNTWWEILLDLSDESRDKAFFAAMDEVISRSDRMLKRDRSNFDAMFFKGAALGFRGRLRSNRGDWFKSAMDGVRAMDYVLGVADKAPANHDYAFGKGIYDYYADVVPDRYSYVKPVMIFFPKGDRERGLSGLERTAKHGTYIQTEAVYFLLQIYYIFENDFAKSAEYSGWLRRRHPDNSFFHAFEGRVYARWGHWHRAQAIFAGVLGRYERKQSGYNDAIGEQALYFLSRGRMIYGEHEEALAYLTRLEALGARHNRDSYFKVLGRLRQGMALDALGRRQPALARYREVLKMKDWADSHDRAKRYMERPYGG